LQLCPARFGRFHVCGEEDDDVDDHDDKMLMIMMIRRRNNFLGSRIISNWLLAPPGHWQHVGYEGHDDVVENRFELQRHHRVRMRMVVGGS